MQWWVAALAFMVSTPAHAAEWRVFGDKTSCTARAVSKWGIRFSLFRELGDSSIGLHLSDESLAENLKAGARADVALIMVDNEGSPVGAYSQSVLLISSTRVPPTLIFRVTPAFLEDFSRAAGMHVMHGEVMLFGVELNGSKNAVARYQSCWDTITGFRRY